MNSVQLRNQPFSFSDPEPQGSKLVVLGKFLLVAAIVSALVIAAYFSVIGFLALIAASAPFWQIGLVGVAVITSITGAVGSIYYSGKHHMLEDTGHNAEDVKNFLIGTLC